MNLVSKYQQYTAFSIIIANQHWLTGKQKNNLQVFCNTCIFLYNKQYDNCDSKVW